ncbi:MAG TPA: hypothetical protein VFS37_16225 [Conexibacter sp.]|nr:hypothetical protein [Conexibacter sp.]
MSATHALGSRGAALRSTRCAAPAAGAGGAAGAPLVAILCAQPRARVAAAGVALALARASGCPLALAGGIGAPPAAVALALPSARRAAAALRRRALPAHASGRLVWVADRRGALPDDDGPSRCAAAGAELGRSAAALGAPAAVAYPFARTDALDRVLAWHDAVVVVREPDAPAVVIERALASLARLGRPAVAMAPPSRAAGALAVAGFAVPAEAAAAVAALFRSDRGRPVG